MNLKLKKYIVSLLTVGLLVGQMGMPLSVAFAAPDRPDRPDTTSTTDEPDEPDLPDNASKTPDPTPAPTPQPTVAPTASPQPTVAPTSQPVATPTPGNTTSALQEQKTSNPSPTPQGIVGNNQVGDTEIESGDSEASGTIINTGNTNAAISPAESGTGGVTISNAQNGTGSTNTGSATVTDSTNTNQDNAATLNNNLNVATDTGNNESSRNVGNSSIQTGDADTTGTIFNAVNTNVEGLMISEFNIVDDHVGDYVLDFESNCIVGCGSTSVSNTNNGSNSVNTGDIDTSTTNNTFQNNDATVENELILSANTGNNTAIDNTAGDSKIETGDANVAGNVVNFLNNNFAGGIVYGVVNVFGDLVGDIVIPESVMASLGISNTGNGSGSTNTGTIDNSQTDTYNQFNNADIVNNLELAATTGDNLSSDNTDGDNSIKTGNADIEAQVINIANTNTVGDNWWLVIVNEAGNWVGKIIGAPGSALAGLMAASQGTNFNVTEDGTINVTNADNGSGSTNTGNVSNTTENNVNQTNNAAITNNVVLDANTGGNNTSRNTGGDNSITTGDANIVVNIVNFVNNNFIGGNALVTVVNVFGSWLGDFVTPGAKQDESTPQQTASNTNDSGIGGNESQLLSSNNVDNQPGSDNDTDSNSSSSSKSSVKALLTRVPRIYSTQGTVLGTSTESKDSVNNESNQEEDLPATPEPMVQNKKTVRINLAWLLPLGLGTVAFMFLRRRILSRAS